MHKSWIIMACLFSLVMSAQSLDNCACCTENHRAFDFWIGEWEVVNAKDGSPAGKSRISKEEDGCVIRENWTSTQVGYTGTSLNFFNAATGMWEQVWVDNAGVVLKLQGNRQGNQMVLSSKEFTKPDGKTYTNRITWTLNTDGTVRQLWEVLAEEGTVSIAFDGLYRPVKKTKNR